MKTFLLSLRDKGINCDCGLPWTRAGAVVVGGPVKLKADKEGWFLCTCGQTRFTWPDLKKKSVVRTSRVEPT